MAANDYYNPDVHEPALGYRDHSDRTQNPAHSFNHALPPPPEENFHYLSKAPSTSYSAASSNLHDEDHELWEDGYSIPLTGRKAKHGSTHTIAPILPQRNSDPFVRDVTPRDAPRQTAKDGWFTGKITWVVYILSIVQLIVFIVEIAKNAILTKSPIEIHPSFNPMVGPSPYVLINMGSRYQPCMHNMEGVQDSKINILWPCPNATSTTGPDASCSLSELCGFGGVPNPVVGGSINQMPAPDQWWRFIIPIFVHAGIVHIGFNLLLQLTLGRDVEKLIGSIRFAIVYFASGIFGFILGGNFAGSGLASCGCSGSLFGILAITLLDLLYTWSQRPSPIRDLIFIFIDIAIAFVLGLLPGLDNFSHIGGFLMGLVLGICILRSPKAIAKRTVRANQVVYTTYGAPPDVNNESFRAFVKHPLNYFRNRMPMWWLWWAVRGLALIGTLIAFILLLQNFYVWRTGCSWCRYLSCLPVTVGGQNWCDAGNLNLSPVSNSTSKRGLFDSAPLGMPPVFL